MEQLIQNALQNGLDDYNQYIQGVTTAVANAYKQHCLGAVENFTALYKDKEYHFTLYYYDQAGNLVKTIPPAGVVMLDFDADNDNIQEYTDPLAIKVSQDRINNTQTVFTGHTLATTYEYNSLNQLVRQNMPDHDQMNIWETTLPNGLDPGMTITKIQYVDGNKGFLTGHVPGPVGDRGLLYTTNDAGATWQRVNDLVGATINKVYFFDNLNGYAACDNGIILKTSNGGGSWDMLLTYDQNIDWKLNDVVFTSATDGVVVGDKEFSLKITGGVTTTLSAPGAFTNSAYTAGGYFKLTSITFDGFNYIAAAKHKASSSAEERGRMYFSNNGLTWTEYTQFDAPHLNNVSHASGTNWIASGQTGNVEKLTTGTSLNGNDLATNLKGNILDAYYMNTNEGIAIIENVPGQGEIHKTVDGGKTWSLLSTPGDYYNRLDVYETGTSTHKVTATGNTSTVDRVIMTTGMPFGIIPLTAPSGTVNYYASWANTFGTTLAMIAGGDAGNVRYTTTAALSATSWTSPSTGLPSSENIRKIAGKHFGTSASA
ncbi:MAG TPA: hypothetical protein VD905_15285, partial [Flavobacteriales bacterium]|nr:hypothetical protein [Flavobacteriales bacterium]